MPPKAAKIKGEYVETEAGNKVSRKSLVIGTHNIMLGGNTVIQADACIRGDLRRTLPASSTSTSSSSTPAIDPSAPTASLSGAALSKLPPAVVVGRYCLLSPSSILKPPSKPYRGQFSYFTLRMGDHVHVGEGAVVEAAQVGSHVSIGRGAVVGKFAIIKDCVQILEGTVVPPGMVVPGFSVVAGRPARVVGEVTESAAEITDLTEVCRRI
ncbi:MAG: hypothetical protein M1825_005125 [Sarcosagium campestre]|nr:MAG: hypothetical protein M1825_005125 [Sarcosagium campestre]